MFVKCPEMMDGRGFLGRKQKDNSYGPRMYDSWSASLSVFASEAKNVSVILTPLLGYAPVSPSRSWHWHRRQWIRMPVRQTIAPGLTLNGDSLPAARLVWCRVKRNPFS